MKEKRWAQKITEMSKDFMLQLLKDAVKEAADGPALRQYMCDGTPELTVHREVRKFGNIKNRIKIVRSGKRGVEFMLDRCYVLVQHPTKGLLVRVAIRDPIPLVWGKTAWHYFANQTSVCPTLRQMGHRGLAIEHYMFDGLMYTAQTRISFQYHQSLKIGFGKTPEESELLWEMEWLVGNLCTMHVGHNGLKWSAWIYWNQADLMKNMYNCVEALRDGFSQILDEIRPWLQSVTRFVAPSPEERTDDFYEFWTVLGLEAGELLDVVCEMRLRFRDGWLEVDVAFEGAPETLDTLITIVHWICRFREFKNARWLTMGR